MCGGSGGTSLAGQTCNEAVVIDCSRNLTGVTIDRDAGLARVEPGAIMKSLRDAANAVGLDFGPDPSTHDRCTLGGMLGNNSCGVHAVMAQFYGPGARTSDNTHRLEVLTYACRTARLLHEVDPTLDMNVNLSPHQLADFCVYPAARTGRAVDTSARAARPEASERCDICTPVQRERGRSC